MLPGKHSQSLFLVGCTFLSTLYNKALTFLVFRKRPTIVTTCQVCVSMCVSKYLFVHRHYEGNRGVVGACGFSGLVFRVSGLTFRALRGF